MLAALALCRSAAAERRVRQHQTSRDGEPRLDPRELMHAHADALFTLDRSGDLFCVNEPAGDVAPRFFLGMTVEGPLVRFRADVDLATRDELTQTAARIEAVPDVLNRPLDPNPFLVILARSKPIEKRGSCRGVSQ